jgi:hypothetical protein
VLLLAPVNVIDPPRLTMPPPDKVPDVLIVIEEFDKAEFGIFVIVFVFPDIVLLLKVWV